MIVLSGLLVLLSIILLVIGLFFSDGLGWVYFSIGTSIAAGVFLVLGALQRRGDAVTAPVGAAPAADGFERVTAVTVTRPEETAAATSGEGAGAGAGAMVSVVPGRPRYHTASCRFLAGRSDVSQVAVEQAKADGYSACGVCKPDDALAPSAPEPAETPAAEETVADDTLSAEEILAAEPAATPARKRTAAATKAPAKKTAAKTASAPVKASGAAAETAAPAKAATKAATKPAKPAAKAAAAEKAAPAKAAAGGSSSTVVVIPDRGKYHVETCRFVRDVPGTVALAKTSAKRQGYAPCGVCKP